MTTPYVVHGARLVAEKPDRGPCWDGEKACRVGLDHRRRRKTGPPWGWVAVLRCTVHRRAFTGYPPGHVPYGPVPVVALAPDGVQLEDDVETLFTAGIVAAANEPELWPRAEAAEGATRSTQIRRVERGASLVGLCESPAGTSTAAAVTHAPCGALVEATRALSAARGLRGRAPIVARVFRDLARRAGRALMDRLAVVGHLAGLWGAPYRWDTRRARLIALGEAFWPRAAAGTRGASPSSSRSGGTHDLGVRDPP